MLNTLNNNEREVITMSTRMASTSVGKVVTFDNFHVEDFVSKQLHAPKLTSKLEDVIAHVKPVFEAWMIADGVFKKNTLEVAKAIGKAWGVYNVTSEVPSKIGFARLFDTSIPEHAKTRDVEDNAVYNKINYLLYKVIPSGQGQVPKRVTSEERKAKREQKVLSLKNDWKGFKRKFKGSSDEVEEVQGLLEVMLRKVTSSKLVDLIFT